MKKIPFLLCLLSLLVAPILAPWLPTRPLVATANAAPVITELNGSADLVAALAPYAQSNPKPPIVLVHGWQGVNFGKQCDDTNPSDPDYNYPDAGWDRVDNDLRALGFHVEMVRLKSGASFTEVNCSPVAQYNAPYVRTFIDRAKAATGQSKVILIGHSMGGLVSRAYLESSLYRGDVLSVYTLGTPHIGVPVSALASWVEAITLGLYGLADYCRAQPVVCQFSDNEASNPAGYTGIRTFNAAHNTRAPGVAYHLVGGDIGFDHRSLTCDPIYLIVGGKNDCIVPLPSALGTGSANGSLGPLRGPIDRKQVYSAHIETFNDNPSIPLSCDYHYNFHNQNKHCVRWYGAVYLSQSYPSNSYTSCVEPSINGRLTNGTCGTVTNYPFQAGAAPVMGEFARTPSFKGSLPTGQSATHTFLLEGGEATLTVYSEAGASLSAVLVSPDGQRLDADSAEKSGGELTVKQSAEGIAYTLRNVQPGAWQLEITNAGKDARYLAVATYRTSVRIALESDKQRYLAGETATLRAALAGVREATVTATVTAPDGSVQTVTLTPISRDLYEGRYIVPNGAGYADIALDVTGSTAQGNAFEQRTTRLLQIAPQSFALDGRFTTDFAASLLGDGSTDLLVETGIAVSEAGLLGLSADLVDEAGNVVAHSNTFAEMGTGAQSLTLHFRGSEIAAVKGTLTLSNVLLVDYSRGGLVVGELDSVHTFSAN